MLDIERLDAAASQRGRKVVACKQSTQEKFSTICRIDDTILAVSEPAEY